MNKLGLKQLFDKLDEMITTKELYYYSIYVELMAIVGDTTYLPAEDNHEIVLTTEEIEHLVKTAFETHEQLEMSTPTGIGMSLGFFVVSQPKGFNYLGTTTNDIRKEWFTNSIQ